MPTMTCPRSDCGGDIEYETDRVDSGDGPWAQSGWVGVVLWDSVNDENSAGSTTCGCIWTPEELGGLDDLATARAAEWPTEP